MYDCITKLPISDRPRFMFKIFKHNIIDVVQIGIYISTFIYYRYR